MKNKLYKTLLSLFFFCLFQQAVAQGFLRETASAGLSAGLHLAFGTHIQRAGFVIHFFYVRNHLQFNTAVRVHYNFRAVGPALKYSELILSPGLVYAFGERRGYAAPFYSPVSNQTIYQNSLGYAYNAYFTRIGTTQQTGHLSLQAGDWNLIAENDLLARPALDRFRTGAFLLHYTFQDQWQMGLSTALWTGQMGRRQSTESPHIASRCYMDSSGARFPSVSAGLLSMQFRWHAGAAQVLQANAGIDAEQVRNSIQNLFFHDLPFLPKKLRPKNCHLPMLDRDGQAYLYKEGQQIRAAKPFLNLSANPPLFY